jgi:dTDP-4-dehydrorhamnose reductase
MSRSNRAEQVFVLGATGMLGSAMVRVLARDPRYQVHAVVRHQVKAKELLKLTEAVPVTAGFDAFAPETIGPIIADCEEPTVINCVGLVKQLAQGNDVLEAAPVNALLPHRLAALLRSRSGRLVHFSTDCVFSGEKGGYVEEDRADARDVYGLTKFLGEVCGPAAVTIRTSIIGHGLRENASLIDWFLAQEGPVEGFRRAVFSGLPTVVLARIVRDHILPRREIEGLYHVSADAIDKLTLLELVRDRYGLETRIEPSDRLIIDRSLNSDRFRELTGWQPEPWPALVAAMHEDYCVTRRQQGL